MTYEDNEYIIHLLEKILRILESLANKG